MLIRYKDKKATLNNLYNVEPNNNHNVIEFTYFTLETNGVLLYKLWGFDTVAERDKVYNIIMNNYFTDIEELANDNN